MRNPALLLCWIVFAWPHESFAQYICDTIVMRDNMDQATYLEADDCLRTLATEYLEKGLFNRAVDMAERDISLHEKMAQPNIDNLAMAYLLLGNAQSLNGNQQLSVESYLKGVLARKGANPDDPKIASLYDQLITKLIAIDDTVRARQYLKEWEGLNQKIGPKASASARLRLAINWASLMEAQGRPELAAKILEDTLGYYAKPLRSKGTNIGVSIAEFNLTELYAQMRNFRKSFEYSEQNIAALELRLKQQKGKLFTQSHYAWYLAQSARASWNLFKETRDTAWLQIAEERANRSEMVLFGMRDRAPEDGFRDWIANSVGIVANLAEVRHGLYALSGDKKHVERSFESVEASKMFVVQQFLHETYALKWSSLPDSVVNQEADFRQSVNELETNYFMLRAKPNADSLLEANDKALFSLRDSYRNFLKTIEKKYPDYYHLKYRQTAASIARVQKELLGEHQCLLDLSVENDLVFALLIRKDTVLWVAAPFDTKTEQALELLKRESGRFPTTQNLPEQEYLQKLQAYADACYQAYVALIRPVRDMLTNEVLLVPRDYVANLPFGAFLTQPETNMGKPHLWHFLENELTISETYSSEFFRFVQNRPKIEARENGVLSLAPFFHGEIARDVEIPVGDLSDLTRRDIFAPLPGSGAEAKAVAQIANGKSLVGTEATKTRFLENCAYYKAIHLATHSVANGMMGEYSFVALQKEQEPQKFDLLFARDIYALNLSAELVVLSACETALGEYREDEGVIGLARAFTCAGARNVVATLWTVNDESTKNLMVLFYKEIDKGLPFNLALSNAKRAFIKQNRQFAHPYYWAGFVLNGR